MRCAIIKLKDPEPVAETTFNRELGAAPAGITRFGQIRTNDGLDVTINSYRAFAGDGKLPSFRRF